MVEEILADEGASNAAKTQVETFYTEEHRDEVLAKIKEKKERAAAPAAGAAAAP